MRFFRWVARVLGFGHRRRVEAMLTRVLEQQEMIMDAQERLADLVSKLNDATNAVGARIAKDIADLAAAQKAGQPPSQASLDNLQASVERLQAMGADPSNPVPSTQPPTEPAPPTT